MSEKRKVRRATRGPLWTYWTCERTPDGTLAAVKHEGIIYRTRRDAVAVVRAAKFLKRIGA